MGRRQLTTIPNTTSAGSEYTFLLDMSGSGEALHNDSDNTLGIANSWTYWTCRFLRAMTSSLGLGDFKNSTTNNDRITMDLLSTGFRVIIRDSAGTTIKNYSYAIGMDVERWYSIAISWDGTSLVAYLNGAQQTATTLTTDTTGTMTTTARSVHSGLTASNNDLNSVWAGAALWSTALSAANMAYITDPNNILKDWKIDVDTYTGSTNLVHQWRPIDARGLQSGTTFVADDIAGSGIDISANAVGITDADMTTSSNDLPYKSTDAHSIEFNGTDEYIQTVTATTLGLITTYTIKITAKSLRDDTNETLFHFGPSGANTNAFRIEKQGASANDPMVVYLYGSTAALLKEYHYYNALPANQWKTYVIVWNSSTDVMTVYDSTGTALTPNATPTDTTGSTTSTARHVAFGASIGGSNFFKGRIREVSLINATFTAAQVGDIAAPGYHMFKLGSNYTMTQLAALERWYLLGKAIPTAYFTDNGTAYILDYGNNSVSQDLSGGSGVTTDNINVTDEL